MTNDTITKNANDTLDNTAKSKIVLEKLESSLTATQLIGDQQPPIHTAAPTVQKKQADTFRMI